MTLLTEYKNQDRTAAVYYRGDRGDFVGVGYIQGLERASHPFDNEEHTELWCEDWVLLQH
jgi:hypothetical protein